CMVAVWVCYILNRDSVGWVTLIIGSGFGLAITLIVSANSDKMLFLLNKSENEKKSFANFIVKNNFTQVKKVTINYFDTIKDPNITIPQQRTALLSILPSIKTFINICEISLPNIGDLMSEETLKEINARFVIIHKLLVILESGSDKQFVENIQNLSLRINETDAYLINKL
ncbi:MAG: hypothetical protein KGL95_03205, partial [Patescibacteria group bacterium]|nr:hypothetical protein [Patescibacteria group bacterium]